jgi:hypothetical protein
MPNHAPAEFAGEPEAKNAGGFFMRSFNPTSPVSGALSTM